MRMTFIFDDDDKGEAVAVMHAEMLSRYIQAARFKIARMRNEAEDPSVAQGLSMAVEEMKRLAAEEYPEVDVVAGYL